MKDKCCSVLFTLAVFVLILTFSIGLPIYFRPFYYAQIESLEITERTGRSYEEIKEGYDEVLDYLTLPGKEFGTGSFAFSETGESHFADCKRLFNLNATAFLVSLAALVIILILKRIGKVKISSPFGFFPTFFAGATMLSLFLLLSIAVAIDFDAAFVVFHSVFFPGKDNWIFSPSKDEIILAMPQEFFMNCAILIVSSIIVLSVLCITHGIVSKKRGLR